MNASLEEIGSKPFV